MFKETKRKGFNFFRSYYDVFNELETDKDKLAFIEALLDRQFLGVKPEGLKGLVKFAWISQVNSIDSQVKGYEDKTKTKLTPTEGGSARGDLPPTEQEKGKEEVKEKGKEEVKDKPTAKAKAFSTEQDFLDFFNKGRKVLLGTIGKTKVMCSTDSNNFKKLNLAYSKEEFKHAITMMSKDEWVKTANKFTISHLLAPKNFDKYLNKSDVRPMAQGLIEGN